MYQLKTHMGREIPEPLLNYSEYCNLGALFKFVDAVTQVKRIIFSGNFKIMQLLLIDRRIGK